VLTVVSSNVERYAKTSQEHVGEEAGGIREDTAC
jgi:hypothetical protein